MSLSDRNPHEVYAELVQRLMDLEEQVALLRANVDLLMVTLGVPHG